MPRTTRKFKSPYASSFTSGVKSGTPCSTVVCTIAKRTNKPVSAIWTSLYKAGCCFRQKFNGTWVYWPSFPVKKSTKARQITQINMWQSFIEWCMATGCCTPKQMNNKTTSQKAFMTYCRTFFGKQFTSVAKPKRSRKRRPTSRKRRTTTTKYRSYWTKHTKKRPATKRTRKASPWGRSTRTFKFPTIKNRPATRRFVRAA